MKIQSLLDITGGKLLNSPSISFITQIHTNINKTNEGDLFISSNKTHIDMAVKKGAYCIITDIKMIPSDNEIAWISVEDISLAAIKLIRFHLANKKLNVLCTNHILFEFLKLFKPNKTQYLFANDPLESLEKIFILNDKVNIISKNKKFLNGIYPNNIDFDMKHFAIENLTIHSLFETTFSFEDKLYYKIKLSAAYIDYLLNTIKFYNFDTIDESKLKQLNFMTPLFLNKSLQIVDFGKSNRFIITSNDTISSSIDRKFINTFYNYAKVDMVDVENFDNHTIYNIIKNSKANCLYLNNCSFEKITTILSQYSKKEQSLL